MHRKCNKSFYLNISELQGAALYCLTQLAQSMVNKKHPDKSRDEMKIKFLDNLKTDMSSTSSVTLGAGDSAREDCHPEYVAEELCRVLIGMFKKISLDTKNYQCSQGTVFSSNVENISINSI